jgi:pSer/pThr/pTyr-binding forkhead associated (FHA) protein
MSMAALYHIGDDGSRTEQWEVDEEPVVVGRNRQAKVNIDDEGVSRRHFLILREGEDYLIKDLNSRNGTWVDGRRVFEEKLHHNDCILAGHTMFLFADHPGSSATAGKLQTGPHGTVMICTTPELERGASDATDWQGDPGSRNLDAAA